MTEQSDSKINSVDSVEENDKPKELSINPFVKVSEIDPSEIPEIPLQNYLFRGPQIADSHNETTTNDKEEVNKKNTDESVKSSNNKSEKRKSGRYCFTSDGRKIRGRGAMRYDSRYFDESCDHKNERSTTPPHWRYEQSKLIKLADVELKALQPPMPIVTPLSTKRFNEVSQSNDKEIKIKHSVESQILKLENRPKEVPFHPEKKSYRNQDRRHPDRSRSEFESSGRNNNHSISRYRSRSPSKSKKSSRSDERRHHKRHRSRDNSRNSRNSRDHQSKSVVLSEIVKK